MPFWLVKASVSPVCKLAIVSVAPVRSVSKEVAVMPESTATAEWPSVNVCPVLPEGVTTGAVIASTTVSTAVLLVVGVALLSSATTSMVRVPLTVLVVENVTDCKAV